MFNFRSVGGEIEDSSIQRTILPQPLLPGTGAGRQTPSLHETHFDSYLDLPRTVLHHPDPYQVYQNSQQQLPPVRTQQLQQRHPSGLTGRPSSSLAAETPWQNSPQYAGGSQRPTSALAGPGSYDTLGSRRMPTPNGHLTTSVKSVFDCDLGCFIDENGEHEHMMFEDANKPVTSRGHVILQSGPVKPETETSDLREV